MQLSKTWQTCEIMDLSQSCKIYGRSGMMQNGIVYQLPPLALLIGGTESGLSLTPLEPQQDRKMLPTPTATDAMAGSVIGKEDTYKETRNGSIRKYTRNGKSGSLALARYVRFYPTPTSVNPEYIEGLKIVKYVDKKCLVITES